MKIYGKWQLEQISELDSLITYTYEDISNICY